MSTFFAVLRHEERADVVDASLISGTHWCKTKDFADWPLDPPLTDRGVKRASALGQHIQQLASECGSPVHIVISSPYHRCMQTAAALCEQFGSNTRLMVDFSLGEVYGPCVFDKLEPHAHFDRFRHQCSQSHVQTAGQWPAWPESLESARRRYANRCLKYLKRGIATQRNFVIVSHGDCVGAALSIMSSDSIVDRIEPGGMFFARRQALANDTRHLHASPTIQTPLEFDALEENNTGDPMRDPLSELGVWRVQLHNIAVRMKKMKPSTNSIVKLCVEELLATLQPLPFGDRAGSPSWMQMSTDPTSPNDSNSSSRLFARQTSGDSCNQSEQSAKSVIRSQKKRGPGEYVTRKAFKNLQRINALMEMDLTLKEIFKTNLDNSEIDDAPGQPTKNFDLANSSLMKRRRSSLPLGTKLSL